MEQIVTTFNELNEKISKIEESMAILPHKFKLIDELNELSKTEKELVDLTAAMKNSLKDHSEIIKKDYKATMKDVDRVNSKMMYLLEYLEHDKAAIDCQENQFLKLISNQNSAARPSPQPSSSGLSSEALFQTPLQMNRVTKLQFTDFDAVITSECFEKIPSYMRGRNQLRDLQDFLENVVIRSFNEKYKIILQKRSVLKAPELTLQNIFRSQARIFEGCKFITSEDLIRGRENANAKRDGKFIQMLRHLQIIRENRKGSLCAYVWLEK